MSGERQGAERDAVGIGSVKACRHCGERIVLVNFAFGPTWQHQKSGAAFMDGMHQFCHVTVAAPAPIPPGSDEVAR